MLKNMYVVQPYQVGTKERKSLAIIIPAKITREYNINTSTILALGIDEKKKRITLREVNTKDEDEEKKMTPANKLPGFQQVPTADQ
jgi:bifunctional DNA-binding transcriptional regulator/antitoxin component of YhaV-PrlF toxin-antitoxin module